MTTVAACVHHWVIEPANGTPHVQGKCKRCGAERTYWTAGDPTVLDAAYALNPSEKTPARESSQRGGQAAQADARRSHGGFDGFVLRPPSEPQTVYNRVSGERDEVRGLSDRQLTLLAYIRERKDGVTTREAADAFGVLIESMYNRLTLLVQRGALKRVPHPERAQSWVYVAAEVQA